MQASAASKACPLRFSATPVLSVVEISERTIAVNVLLPMTGQNWTLAFFFVVTTLVVHNGTNATEVATTNLISEFGELPPPQPLQIQHSRSGVELDLPLLHGASTDEHIQLVAVGIA